LAATSQMPRRVIPQRRPPRVKKAMLTSRFSARYLLFIRASRSPLYEPRDFRLPMSLARGVELHPRLLVVGCEGQDTEPDLTPVVLALEGDARALVLGARRVGRPAHVVHPGKRGPYPLKVQGEAR